MDWFYYIWKNIEDGELFCVQEHDLRENVNDLPTKTGWYICKVKSSHDLRLVFGYEDVTQEKFDAWIEVRCNI